MGRESGYVLSVLGMLFSSVWMGKGVARPLDGRTLLHSYNTPQDSKWRAARSPPPAVQIKALARASG